MASAPLAGMAGGVVKVVKGVGRCSLGLAPCAAAGAELTSSHGYLQSLRYAARRARVRWALLCQGCCISSGSMAAMMSSVSSI